MKLCLMNNNIMGMKWSTVYSLVVMTYILSHCLMLAVYGAWWDDMISWNVSQEELEDQYRVFNNPFVYYITKWVASIDNMELMTFVYRLIPFVCWLISISAFFFFVKKITGNRQFTLYSSLLAASCGLNKCMLMICCYHYTISIMLFMVGLVFFTYDYYKEKLTNKMLVALLWTLSLLIWRSAVLVIPMALLYVSYLKKGLVWNSFGSYKILLSYTLKHYWPIIVGLFVFAVLYKTILAPQGEYAAYYSIGIKPFLFSPITTVICSISTILGYISNLFSELAQPNGPIIFLLFLAMCLCTIFLCRIRSCDEKTDVKNYILLLACLFLFFSIMPHMLREFLFSFNLNGYHSRVTALAVFPISMILAYGLILIRNRGLQSVLCSTLVLSSIVYSTKTYLNYEKGWLKNEAIASFFKGNEYLKGHNIAFVDNSSIYSPFQNEGYRYYDYEGCARLSYGKNDVTKCSELESLKHYKRFETTDYYIFIDVNEHYSNVGMRSLFYRFSNYNKRNEMKKQMLSFRIYTKQTYATD